MSQPCLATVRGELTQIKHLPPLSHTASRLLQVLSDEEIDIGELAEIIEQDSGVTARIIGLANSAFFGQVNPVNTIQNAIIRVLGLNIVKNLALGIAIAGAFDPRACQAFDLDEYWAHALGTALMGRLLARQISSDEAVDPDSVYLCGLLHQIGTLLLAHSFPGRFSSALTRLATNPDEDIRSLEREELGIDHVEAGEWLARRWHLPESVVNTVTSVGDEDYAGDYAAQVALVTSTGNWMQALLRGEPYPLAEDSSLDNLSRLNETSLSILETKFIDQFEELRATARLLSR